LNLTDLQIMNKENPRGHIHPVTQIILKSVSIFKKSGFSVASGPELEDEWHNFDALNIPADHPARDMQDTFWLKQPKNFQFPISNFQNSKREEGKSQLSDTDRQLLRTHTSPVQIRYIEQKLKKGIKPPYRIIVPGKVFRNEATDATHEAQFHQIEGLYVDKNVSMAQLKGTLSDFAKEFFGDNAEIRFRPSFFPFTEPSVEVDVKFRGKWLEILGAGLVHPNVLKSVGLNPDKWSGFAFGMSVERPAMIKWGINDIRQFYSGDMRFLKQF